MRRLLVAVLAVPLIAATAPKGTIALGVGAASSTEVVVKINGRNETVKLAGIKNGTYAGQAFLQCLVANRIVRVDRVANRVTMLDGTSVADHLAEFLLSKTASDPCAIGKAAYAPMTPPLASSVVVAQPGTAAETGAPPKHRGTASFGSAGSTMKSEALAMPQSSAPQPQRPQRSYAPAPQPANDQPTIYRPPTVGTVQIQPGSTYTMPSGTTTTIPSTDTVNPAQAQPYTPPQAGTTTIPTTTTSPP